jgi:predicted nucleic acid-binding protein
VILLDTNYLIRALVDGSSESERVIGWLNTEEELCTSAIAWYEFLSGPVDDEGVDVIRAVLQDRVLPFTADCAAEAARLYNSTGRIRRLRVDAMIAASAIMVGARLATENEADFQTFTGEGLRLV